MLALLHLFPSHDRRLTLYVSNSYGSDNGSHSITTYSVPPSCLYTASVMQGTSPLQITFTDTSSYSPTSYIWNFNPNQQGYITVSPNSYLTTKNATVLIRVRVLFLFCILFLIRWGLMYAVILMLI